MVFNAVSVLVLSAMLFAVGASVLRHWRLIGETASHLMDPTLLFGPLGERVLVPAGVAAMGAGVLGAAHAIMLLMS